MAAASFPSVDPERHRVLAGRSRVRVLKVLRAHATPLSVDDIAGQVGLHPNTVRLHLDQLVGAGLATRESESRNRRPGRPRLAYAATPVGDAPAAGPVPPGVESDGTRYQVLADVLVGHLEATSPDPAAEAAAAGRAWGESLGRRHPVARASVAQAAAELTGILDELGFAPRPNAPGDTIELHRCPFGQVPEHPSPVVCGVHLGLMQGTLSSQGAPMRVSALEPFVTPSVCVARFATDGVAGGRGA